MKYFAIESGFMSVCLSIPFTFLPFINSVRKTWDFIGVFLLRFFLSSCSPFRSVLLFLLKQVRLVKHFTFLNPVCELSSKREYSFGFHKLNDIEYESRLMCNILIMPVLNFTPNAHICTIFSISFIFITMWETQSLQNCGVHHVLCIPEQQKPFGTIEVLRIYRRKKSRTMTKPGKPMQGK